VGGTGGSGGSGFGGVAGSSTGTLADGGTDPNLIVDPGFESGVSNWVPWGTPIMIQDESGPYGGTHAMLVTNRSLYWHGASYHLQDLITAGATYHASFWVRTSAPRLVKLTSKKLCDDDTASVFAEVAAANSQTQWQFFEGDFVAPTCSGTLLDFRILFESDAGVDIYVDEVRVLETTP
jgi:hypothetical protein